jgi:hypothetical protein
MHPGHINTARPAWLAAENRPALFSAANKKERATGLEPATSSSGIESWPNQISAFSPMFSDILGDQPAVASHRRQLQYLSGKFQYQVGQFPYIR